jgi:hypothetical protein
VPLSVGTRTGRRHGSVARILRLLTRWSGSRWAAFEAGVGRVCSCSVLESVTPAASRSEQWYVCRRSRASRTANSFGSSHPLSFSRPQTFGQGRPDSDQRALGPVPANHPARLELQAPERADGRDGGSWRLFNSICTSRPLRCLSLLHLFSPVRDDAYDDCPCTGYAPRNRRSPRTSPTSAPRDEPQSLDEYDHANEEDDETYA